MARNLVIAGGLYLIFSLFVWSKLWTGHPTATATCGCGDSSLFTWFLNWPAYAISHGLNPLYTKTFYYPHGVNLLASTSQLAIGVVLAPITWIFGPVATLNVALTLSPALSALAMFFLLRRWVSWAPAAFVGGLLYGFSPFVITALTNAHLMVGMAAVPPLVIACIDELLLRQRGRPVMIGIVLGLLVTLQFFIGVEVLLIMAIMTLVGLIIIVVYALWKRPQSLRQRVRFAGLGLVAGGITSCVLLAYPAWFALNGPSSLHGAFWPASFNTSVGTSFNRFLIPQSASSYRAGLSHTLVSLAFTKNAGGYPGPLLSNQYFGFGVAVVLIGGLAIWRQDLKLWFFAALAAASGLLSLGTEKGQFLPWSMSRFLLKFSGGHSVFRLLPDRTLRV
jgi:hypothetical protein